MDHKAILTELFAEAGPKENGDTRQAAFRSAFTTRTEITDEELATLEALVVGEFDEMARDDAVGVEELRWRADFIRAARAEQKDRLAATTAKTTPADEPGSATPAAPASTADNTAPAPQEAPQMDNPTATPGTEVVAASATRTVLKPTDVQMPWELMPFEAKSNGSNYTITAAAGATGIEAGEQFSDVAKLSRLIGEKIGAMGRGMSEPSQMLLASARPEDWSNAYSNITRSGIASLLFEREHDFVMEHQHDWFTIERACNESRLPGGSLTPAPSSLTAAPGTPGWCAPCEIRYDFCPIAVIDGLVDLPTVIATRGCLTYPVMPDFGLLYQGAGFCYPADNFDPSFPPPADPTAPWARNKPCMPVPCPETQTCTLDPCGICLQSSILVERAYPELIQYFIGQALVAWGHKMNCRDLQQMITASTAVRVPRDQTGPGAAASVLEVVEFYATWLRYKYRLGRNASVEAVFPDWLKGVIRADLSKRMGVDMLAVTDQMIDNWLALRKIRVQWVLGLDEAFCDTTGSTATPPAQIDPKTSLKFGGNVPALGAVGPPAVPPILWPKTVSFLMYPAGTFFRARMNLVNIEGGLVDSALLKRNERLLLFVEEASVVCKRCYESLYITMDICPSGQTGAGSISQPVCETFPEPEPQPAPVVTVTEAAGDPDRMSVSVTVDNHGFGPVSLTWGQPGLTGGTNPGDGTTATTKKYTEDGTWTITATDSSNPEAVGTAPATVPFGGGLVLTLTVEDADPGQPTPRYTASATWDNQGQGEVKLFWRDARDPAASETKPDSGTDTHVYDSQSDGSVTVRVEDSTTPARFAEQTITLPDFA